MLRKRLAVLALASLITFLGSSVSAAPSSGLEIRWFQKGPVPERVVTWFESERLGGVIAGADIDRRADVYLVAEQAENAGLKLREGDLELKLRRGIYPVELLGGSVSGQAEAWDKWGWKYQSGTPDPVLTAFSPALNGTRRTVAKERRQHKFELRSGDDPVPVAAGTRVKIGCAAEVTSIRADQGQSWTLAVETLGTTDLADLELCGEWILRDYPVLPLRSSESRSYPAWLLISDPPNR